MRSERVGELRCKVSLILFSYCKRANNPAKSGDCTIPATREVRRRDEIIYCITPIITQQTVNTTSEKKLCLTISPINKYPTQVVHHFLPIAVETVARLTVAPVATAHERFRFEAEYTRD